MYMDVCEVPAHTPAPASLAQPRQEGQCVGEFRSDECCSDAGAGSTLSTPHDFVEPDEDPPPSYNVQSVVIRQASSL
jgi:hypothetical protein